MTLTFDLHNRHTYSEEQMKDKRTAFTRYTASIGALTLDNTLISRAAVQSEFRVQATISSIASAVAPDRRAEGGGADRAGSRSRS